MGQGFAFVEMIFDPDNQPVDYRFLEINPVFEAQTGLREAAGKTVRELVPDLEAHWFELYGKVALTGEPVRFTNGSQAMGRWFEVYAFRTGEKDSYRVAILFTDITPRKQAEEALRESEERFRTMAADSDILIAVSDETSNATYFSRAWVELTGRPVEELLRFGWTDLIHSEDRERFVSIYLTAFQKRETFSGEFRILNKAGQYRWLWARAPARFRPDGSFAGYISSCIDITDRSQAEQARKESEERFRAIADNIPTLAWMAAADGWIFWYNQRWYEYTGTTPEQMEGWGWQSVHDPRVLPQVTQQWSTSIATGKPLEMVFPLKGAGGGFRPFLTRVVPLRDEKGKIVSWFGTNTDIYEQQTARQQLQALNEELATASQELAAANEELRAANEEIHASNEELSQSNQLLTYTNADLDNFVYAASHDLKAPILNIEGLLKTLQRQLSQKDPDQQEIGTIFGFLNESVGRFKTTIGDLTEVARISKESQEDIAPIDTGEVLGQVLRDVQPQIEEAAATFELPPDCPVVQFSRKNLKSILYNLVSNALKYRSPERRLLVRISCRQEESYQVLSVEDNGLGMDMRQEKKIFALFKRLHSHVEGTGVGLYMVKKMIENAGGRIEVESQVNIGSTFRVYFRQQAEVS